MNDWTKADRDSLINVIVVIVFFVTLAAILLPLG